ncbi:MAG: AAA family ATPase [Cyanobacteriota bacterium]|nr:AAA family ATPase [Cyanobacteriota bacterium]
MSNLLESFREAYRNLQLLPLLSDENLEKFEVEYGKRTIEELEQRVEDSPSGNTKIIFAGHRGCGKSTLLAKFSRQLESRFFVVFFSISDTIEMSDVNHINILFAIGVQMMLEAEKREIKINKATRKSFSQWFAKKTRTEINQVNAEVSGGFDLFKIIAGKLKIDSAVREEIKQEFLRNTSELIDRINEIAETIKKATNKEMLVVIDDLDKLDLSVVDEIYKNNVKTLFQPDLRIIFTIPISALRDVEKKAVLITESSDAIAIMSVSKLFSKEQREKSNSARKSGVVGVFQEKVFKLLGKEERRQIDPVPNPEPVAVLKEAIAKRVKSELIEEETLNKIILYSGGVLRELIRITNECCRVCLQLIRRNPEDTNIKINHEVLRQAIKEIRIDFDMGIGTTDYQILKEVYEDLSPRDANEERFLDLLHGLYVLEYRNAELWYDIHPIVTELLQQKGVL